MDILERLDRIEMGDQVLSDAAAEIRRLRALSPPEPTEATEAMVEQIIRDVAELPDRTSPPDDHEMMLVTAFELRRILQDRLAALRAMPLQDHGWQPIKTAAPRREVWLFTPGARLGSDCADDIRFECPANWTWATMWMPAQVPAAPAMVAEQREVKS